MRSVRLSYLAGTRVLRKEDPGESFFWDAPVPRTRRLDRGSRASWGGVCLADPPRGADAVRIEVEVTAQRGPGFSRSVETAEVPLVDPPSTVGIRPPFLGVWRVSQGHSCRTNHRLGGYGGDFAWDFVAVDPRTGSSTAEGYARSGRNQDTATFGRPILAPVGGRIVRAVDGVADNEGLREYPGRTLVDELAQPLWIFGNHVVLSVGDGGPYVLLGHLRKGSVRVKPGDVVREGDVLGEAGNSGNSIEPHLHVHVMDREDAADPGVAGLPARLENYLSLHSQARAGRRDSVIRHVDAGDPREGDLILSASAADLGAAGAPSPPLP
jgi:murein DD-endopeptidase MepM/ murein hydrolase activator NlpD